MPVENPTVRDMLEEWESWQKVLPLAIRGAQYHGPYKAVFGERPPLPYELRTPRLAWLTTEEIATRLRVAYVAADSKLTRDEAGLLYDYAGQLRRAWAERH
jgi:hypothetical protein